jgi:hypothetical protein
MLTFMMARRQVLTLLSRRCSAPRMSFLEGPMAALKKRYGFAGGRPTGDSEPSELRIFRNLIEKIPDTSNFLLLIL